MNNISALFKDLHGAIDKSTLVPLYEIAGKDKDLPSKKQFNAVVKFLNIPPDELYYDTRSVFNRIIYLSKYIYIPLHVFTVDGLRTLNVVNVIKNQKQRFQELEEQENYEDIFMYMDKKLLIPTYKEVFEKIPSNQRYEIFVDLHVRSEYGFEMFDAGFLRRIFSFKKFSPHYKKRLEKLKAKVGTYNKFTVYHGHNKKHDPKDEYSWTLKIETAEFFANRFSNQGTISKKSIMFRDVIDFYDHRGEDEIILLTKELM